MKPLTCEEYQQKLNNIRTPQEAAQFMKELSAPIIAKIDEGDGESIAPHHADVEASETVI